MSLLKVLNHNIYCVLWTIERFHCCSLSNRVWIRGGLRLNFPHRRSQCLIGRGESNTPTGHGIGFGYTVDHNSPFLEFRACIDNIAKWTSAPLNVLVNVVCQYVNLRMFQQHLCQLFQFLTRICNAGRVAGAIQHQQLGTLCNGFPQLFRLQFESLLDISIENYWIATRKNRHVGIGNPVWRNNNNFISIIKKCSH